MKSYNVIFSRPCSNGNHFIKLQRKGAVATNKGMFGSTSLESSETYFVFGSIPQAVGSVVNLNPAQWRVELKPYQIPGGDLVDLKYLTEFVG